LGDAVAATRGKQCAAMAIAGLQGMPNALQNEMKLKHYGTVENAKKVSSFLPSWKAKNPSALEAASK